MVICDRDLPSDCTDEIVLLAEKMQVRCRRMVNHVGVHCAYGLMWRRTGESTIINRTSEWFEHLRQEEASV